MKLILFINLILFCNFANADQSKEFIKIINMYIESYKNNNADAYLKVTSKDKISFRKLELKKINNNSLTNTLCRDIKSLENSLVYDGYDLKMNNEYARLILFSNKNTATTYPPPENYYRSTTTYIFFKKENITWKFLDYVSSKTWDPVKLTDLTEQKLDIQYQLKRHKFRFMQYDFQVISSISNDELQKIISVVNKNSKHKIISITRGRQDDDIRVPWIMHGQNMGYSIQLKNPNSYDTKIEVYTSQSDRLGNHHGETFYFNMVNGNWVLENKGNWIE